MKNRPGLSWGEDCPVNLIKTVGGFLVVDFKQDEQIYSQVYSLDAGENERRLQLGLRICTELNYGTLKVDEPVLKAIDETA